MKIKFLITSLFLMISLISWSQELKYKSGYMYDSNNQKLNTEQVQELMSKDLNTLALYKKGTNKSIINPILVGTGAALLIGDLIKSVSTNVMYPTALTYIGIGSIAVSIPLSIIKTNKIKKSVDSYNQYIKTHKTTFLIEKKSLIANQNGIGLQLTF
jgi:hypothetical protein